MNGAEGGTRTPTSCLTRPSNVRVCQFRHFGSSCQSVTQTLICAKTHLSQSAIPDRNPSIRYTNLVCARTHPSKARSRIAIHLLVTQTLFCARTHISQAPSKTSVHLSVTQTLVGARTHLSQARPDRNPSTLYANLSLRVELISLNSHLRIAICLGTQTNLRKLKFAVRLSALRGCRRWSH